MTPPPYRSDLGGYVLELVDDHQDGHPLAGTLVHAFDDGSMVALDRLDPTRVVRVLLCGDSGALGTDATILASHLFGGTDPDAFELREPGDPGGAHWAADRALAKLVLASSRAGGRRSLWWAEAATAMASWCAELGARPPHDRLAIWCQRSVAPLSALADVASREPSATADTALGALLPLVDTVCEHLEARDTESLLDFQRWFGGGPISESAAEDLLREAQVLLLGPMVGAELGFRGSGDDPGPFGSSLGASASSDVQDSELTVELDVAPGLVTSAWCRRLDENRVVAEARLVAEMPRARLYVSVVDERGRRLDHLPASVTGATARCVLLVPSGARSRVRWSATPYAEVGTQDELSRKALLQAAGRLADRTRTSAAIEAPLTGLAAPWSQIASMWAALAEPHRAERARALAASLAEGDWSPLARAFVTNVEALSGSVELDLGGIDPAEVNDPASLVSLAYDIGAAPLAADLALEASAELLGRGDGDAAVDTVRLGIAACSDDDDPPLDARADLYRALGRLEA